jgi:hypothetical protein
LQGEEMEIGVEDVKADQVGLDQDSWGDELDGVEFEEAEDVFVEWGEGEFGNEIEAAGDAGGVGDDLVVGGGEIRASGAGAGVGVDGGILE